MISWLENNYKFSWLITIIIALTIFYFSSLTGAQTSKVGSNLNATLYHIIIFFLFAFFLSISLVKGKNKELLFLAIILSIAYGLIDELHQHFIPGRSTSIKDFMLDSIGVIFASMLYSIRMKYREITKTRNRLHPK